MEVYFTRPGTKCEVRDRLIEDISKVKERLLIAVAYFNDEIIAEKINDVRCDDKRIIVNYSDIFRDVKARNIYSAIRAKTTILGTKIGDNYPNHMHHKFIILDNIVWTGSFNFTSQASFRNWENMIRITDFSRIQKFTDEFEYMWLIGEAVRDKLKYDTCDFCKEKVEDPLTHFGIIFNTSSFVSGLNYKDTYSVMCAKDFKGTNVCRNCNKTVYSKEMITLDDSSSFWSICLECFPDEMRSLLKARDEINMGFIEDE
ncbi:phospholipase D family protein [Paenibacillus planticolens]|uniref:phospholipase D n=1 Tax=Paenibacillus planticolens TaxID=2654976 RepID=A0ABX1ZUJ7_9BACL|nr:phospholipase D family protein [Paenibacillus planticolens]NOV02720.1 hypothetical protein [Paenibacillus planticolens]